MSREASTVPHVALASASRHSLSAARDHRLQCLGVDDSFDSLRENKRLASIYSARISIMIFPSGDHAGSLTSVGPNAWPKIESARR